MKIETLRRYAFLDITISGDKIGRVVVELYDDLAPKASQNFLELCQKGTTLSFQGCAFHKVVKNFMIQSGDLTYGKLPLDESNIGKGGASIYSDFFEDENMGSFETTFNLAMANTGPNTNLSQFFVNTYPSPHLNGKHTIFGKVIYGKSTIRTIERVAVDNNNVPKEPVIIEDCGEWREDMGVPVYNASYDTIGGDVYEEFPDDDEHFDKDKASESYEACFKIKDSGSALFKAKNYKGALLKYQKALRYINEFLPDEDSEPEFASRFQDLKKKTLNNLALACMNLKEYQKAIDYSTYLIENDYAVPLELAKAHYRRGVSLYELGKYQEALKDLQDCSKHNPNDQAVKVKIEDTEKKVQLQKAKEKQKYAKFFG